MSPSSLLSPLANIKVLDFSRILAAPLASMILGDLGAQVWKVEKPGTGDETRLWNTPSVNGQSCYFLTVNRNKRSVALNLAHREGQQLARRLAQRADVLLENFKTGQMRRFGLDYERLRGDNPRLVYCSLTGYGSTGPYAGDPGYDVIAEAIGGMLGITGPKASSSNSSSDPCKIGVALIDAMTGLYAHGAILAALFQRETTGRGQHVQCNLLATQIAALLNIGSNFLNAGLQGRPLGTEHESLVPYQTFRTRDNRHYVVGAPSDEAFRELCQLLDLSELADSDDYRTLRARVQNRESLIAIFEQKFASEDLAHWTARLRSTRFPSGPVNTVAEAFAHPQVRHLGLVQQLTHPVYGPVRVVGPPVEFSGAENVARSAPPLLGEHTREVLGEELGLSTAEMERLKKDGAIDYC